MTLHETIATARKAKGLTLRQLEQATGISNAALSQIETGWIVDPSFRKIVKIAQVLGLSLTRLAKEASHETE